MKLSTGAINSILRDGAYHTFSGGGFQIYLYSGAQPASPDDAPTGTLLAVQASNIGDSYGPANGKSYQITGNWVGSADTTGVVGWFRLRDFTVGSNSPSTTEARIDGTVTEADGHGDIILSSTSLIAGNTIEQIDTLMINADVFSLGLAISGALQ